MMQCNWRLPSLLWIYLSCQHVHLSLVHTCMGDICLQFMYIYTLHRRVEILCQVELLLCASTHYCQCPCGSSYRNMFAELEHILPVCIVAPVEVASKNYSYPRYKELERISIIFRCKPYPFPVSAKLSVYCAMPVCQVHCSLYTCCDKVFELEPCQNKASKVKESAYLKSYVMSRLILFFKQLSELLHSYHFLGWRPFHKSNLLVYLHGCTPTKLRAGYKRQDDKDKCA